MLQPVLEHEQNLATIHALRVPAERLIAALERLQPLAQLAARCYIARVFFLSGLTKIRDWETTLALFTDEYKVPLLPLHIAAPLGTGGELVLPVLLLWGPGRLSADHWLARPLGGSADR